MKRKRSFSDAFFSAFLMLLKKYFPGNIYMHIILKVVIFKSAECIYSVQPGPQWR